MGHELICSWLGISCETWPPNHHVLLGLDPGETDPARIEQHVHERMERVRRYQLTNPELATEAMNRLAQALICLTDACNKRRQETVQAVVIVDRSEAVLSPAEAPTWPLEVPDTGQVLDWETAPPPRRDQDTITASLSDTATDVRPALELPVDLPHAKTAQAASAVDPAIEAARLSQAARRGLATKRALYYRIARTRQLIWAWERVGKYLNEPNRTLTRPAEATDLANQLKLIRDLLRSFPPLLGEAGQPGCYVMALARQQVIVPTFQTLLASQRERLAEDWQSGLRLLNAHRDFLREELHGLRHRGAVARIFRAIRAALAENPGTLLLVVALVALNLAYPALWQRHFAEQIVVFLAMAAFKVYLVWDSIQEAKPIPVAVAAPPPQRRVRRSPRPQQQAN
jgi:hypothetical protein